MKLRYLRTAVAVLLLLQAQILLASPISEAEALKRAQRFMSARGKTMLAPARARITTDGQNVTGQGGGSAADIERYYIFNAGGERGFVIVSGDDQTAEILGYADQGSINEDSMPDALRYWLDGYAQQIAWAASHAGDAAANTTGTEAPAATRSTRAARTAISPLIQTQWNQGAPYNNLCPTIGEERTVTGCVATAMAQVMYYHQHPTSTTTAIPGYTSGNINVPKLEATTFDWNSMTTTYSSGDTGDGADAVAKLMQYCGAAVQMIYGTSASSAYNPSIVEALTTYFGYDGSTSYAERQHYTYQQWIDLIYGELAEGRPVILGGQSLGGGHSFVCDGYDTDDYFHINWGWGGNSDAYFRLSVLNPDDQGIGGSSSLDGFSYSQDAVIVRSSGSTSAAPRLTVEKLQFKNEGSSSTQVVSLTDGNYPIDLYVEVCNYQLQTTNFDWAVVLTDEQGNMIGGPLYSLFNNPSFEFNTNQNLAFSPYNLSSSSVPNGDGTYYIKVMSRANGSDTWLDCYDGDQLKIKAVVSNNTMTLTAPFVYGSQSKPASVTFTSGNNPTVGYELPITASVKGGSVDYHGNLVLRVNGTAVMGKVVDIPADQTVDVTFAYTPSASGDNKLSLWTAKSGGTQISGSQTITVGASDATNDLNLTCTYTIDNLDSSGKLYGNALRATVTVSNASSANSYSGKLYCRTYQWTKTSTTGGYTMSSTTLGTDQYDLTIGKNSSTNVAIAVDDLPSGDNYYYCFQLGYQNNSSIINLGYIGVAENDENNIGTLQLSEGYSLGDATGTTTIYAASTSINAGNACFVDLSGLSSFEGVTVTPSTNPNCLYLLKEGATAPSSLEGKNVVKGTTAESLTLTDGYDFYAPIDFTASSASYTRTFSLAAGGTSGWNSLMLPFDATTVSVKTSNTESRTATWFKSDNDTNGSFWLREFTTDESGTVNFDYVQGMTANKPYIIAVPGDSWGDEWKMTERPVTFSASSVQMTATITARVSGNYYKFCGSTTSSTLTAGYILNDTGSKFAKVNSSTTVPAFRGWFEAVSISSLTLPSLAIGNPATTAILGISQKRENACPEGWFTLDGRRLSSRPSAPGLYINNGRKVVIR